MPSVTRSPGTLASSGGSVSWSNPGNAASSNDSRATIAGFFNSDCDYLRASNYGFDGGADPLPEDATVTSIVLSVERRREGAGDPIWDSNVRLAVGGSLTGTSKAVGEGGGEWPASDTVRQYTWTPGVDVTVSVAQIRASGFGAGLKPQIGGDSESSGGGGGVDHVSITVHYTEAAPPASGNKGLSLLGAG